MMKDTRGEVIYVGKAKILRNRVRSYFQSSGDERLFIKFLVKRISDIDFVLHAIDEFSKMGHDPNYIVHIRPTTPIRDPEVIDNAISLFQKSNMFNSLRSVHLMSESSYKTFEINNESLTPLSLLSDLKVDTNAPRQSFPETYQANGYVDVLSTSFIRKNKEIHGKKILPFITETAYEVDTLEDFNFLEYLAANSKEIINKLF